MISVEECEQALHALAGRLEHSGEPTRGRSGFDRTLSCRLTDPEVCFAGRLRDGGLDEIRRVETAEAARAKIRLRMSGADLLSLVAGRLDLARAWSSGQLKVEANPLDLLRLRSIF